MAVVLAATSSGLRAFTATGEGETELAGRQIWAVAPETGGTCLAVIDGKEIWRRAVSGAWSSVATATMSLQSIASIRGTIFGGGADEAEIVRIPVGGPAERLSGLDKVPGRREWFAGGPPLGVRALAATADGAALLAAVHVGGIPLSLDGGDSWTSTIPIAFDVHEVRAHPSLANLAAAATAVGLCVSQDGGRNWTVFAEGLDLTNSLALAVLQEEVLFSIQDGPFAKRSQVWRWRIGGKRVEPVREGLPEWLEGKVDTAKIAVGGGRAAVVDQGGNLWLSKAGSSGWERLAGDVPDVCGLLLL